MMINTAHMSGAGNTFAVLHLPSGDVADVVPALCNRSALGLPAAEGVIVLRHTGIGTFTADFYNPDGSMGMMCGNGARAAVRFALDHGAALDENGTITFTMANETYTAMPGSDNTIRVEFPVPRAEHLFPAGTLHGIDRDVRYYDVNSDHVVVIATAGESVDGILALPLIQALRWHDAFARGVNVNIVEASAEGTFRMATFERGVEGITGACGTGALSTAIALWRTGAAGSHVTLQPPSGRPLHVHIHHTDTTINGLALSGDAQYDAPQAPFDETTQSYSI